MKMLILAALLAVYIPSNANAQAPQVPLPPDMTIVATAPDVPSEIARFHGSWGKGKWDDTLPSRLVVEQVKPNGEATVVYAWGDYAPWHIKGNWERITTAKINGGTLEFALMRKSNPSEKSATFSYEYKPDGTLAGTYTLLSTQRVSKITLERETQR